MKRLSLVGILCSIRALMGLGPRHKSTLGRDILGEWTGDPKLLEDPEWMGGGPTALYPLDLQFDNEPRGTMKAEVTVSSLEGKEGLYFRLAIVFPIIYNANGDTLTLKFDQDAIQAEILEYLINGERYEDLVAKDIGTEDEEVPPGTYEEVAEAIKNLTKEHLGGQLRVVMARTYSYEARVEGDHLMIKQKGKDSLITFQRKKSQGATAP